MRLTTLSAALRPASVLLLVALLGSGCTTEYAPAAPIEIAQVKVEPLDLWNDGTTRQRIVEYVERVTDKNSPDFIPVEERVATFDHDGTLWGEYPPVWGMLMEWRLRQMIGKDPAMAEREPFKTYLAKGLDYLEVADSKTMDTLFGTTETGMSQREWDGMLKEFFATQHPNLGAYQRDVYAPMHQLADYLADNGFTVYIVTGSETQMVRAVAQEYYGIPPERIIGSSWELMAQDGESGMRLMRQPKTAEFVNKEIKPIVINRHIGRIPVFAAGNDGNAGDIAMLRYAQSNPRPNFELMVAHDDAAREKAYGDKNGESLAAAKRYGWAVASMKNDWKQVFSDAPKPAAAP